MPNLSAFLLLAKNAPYQLYRFAVNCDQQMNNLQHTIRLWESRELGSIKGVLNAYAYVIPLIAQEKRLDLEDIKMIHKICMTDVRIEDIIIPLGKDLHARIEATFPIGELRRGYSGAFSVVSETCSDLGLRELVKSHVENLYWIRVFPKDVCASEDERIALLKNLLDSPSRSFEFWSYDGNLTEEEKSEFTRMADKIELDQDYNLPPRYVQLKEKYQANLSNEIKRILEGVYDILDVEPSENDKLIAIVRAVQRLERLHPFYDGNCRTFCMVLLNTLLMQAGFPPSLFDDPNKFDGYSIQELVNLILEGIERTKQLCAFVINEQSNPTIYNKIQRPIKDPLEGPTVEDVMDIEDYITLNHWMEIHPIQRANLLDYAFSLVTTLHTHQRTSSVLVKRSLFRLPLANNLQPCEKENKLNSTQNNSISLEVIPSEQALSKGAFHTKNNEHKYSGEFFSQCNFSPLPTTKSPRETFQYPWGLNS